MDLWTFTAKWVNSQTSSIRFNNIRHIYPFAILKAVWFIIHVTVITDPTHKFNRLLQLLQKQDL